jgi:Na+-driven multidrug efflux pump
MTEISYGDTAPDPMFKKIRALLSISVPIGIDLGILFATFFIDSFFLSSYSLLAAAAVGALFSLYGLIGMVLRQVAQAGAIVMAQHTGSGNSKRVAAAQTALLLNGTMLGFISVAVSMIGSFSVPAWLGLDAEARIAAQAYMISVGPGLLFLSLKYSFAGFGLVMKDTKPQMYSAVVAVLVNLALNWVFLEFGIFGHGDWAGAFSVGLATGIAYFASAAVLWMFNDVDIAALTGSTWSSVRNALEEIWVKALPTTIEPAAIQIQWIVLTGIIVTLGVESLATRIYVLNIEMFVLVWSLAIAIAVQVQTAHLFGEGRLAEANSGVVLGNGLGALGAALIAVTMYVFSDQLLGLFTDNRQVLETGKILLAWAIPAEISKAIYNTTCWSLVSRGDHRFPVIASVLVLFFVGLPAAWYLCAEVGLGLVGIWIALALDETIRAALMTARWYWLNRKSFSLDAEVIGHA